MVFDRSREFSLQSSTARLMLTLFSLSRGACKMAKSKEIGHLRCGCKTFFCHANITNRGMATAKKSTETTSA
jgi:hypothetical protein